MAFSLWDNDGICRLCGNRVRFPTSHCRLCRGEPFVEWSKKDEPRIEGATHHTCHPGEEHACFMLFVPSGHDAGDEDRR